MICAIIMPYNGNLYQILGVNKIIIQFGFVLIQIYIHILIILTKVIILLNMIILVMFVSVILLLTIVLIICGL